MPKDSKDYLGTLVGGGVGGTGMFPLIRAIQDAKALTATKAPRFSRKPIPKGTFKAGDIILTSDLKDVKNTGKFDVLKQLVQRGQRDMGHASIILPLDPKSPNSNLRVVNIGALDMPRFTTKYRALDTLIKGVAKGNLRKLPRSLRLGQKLSTEALTGKLLTEDKLHKILKNSQPVNTLGDHLEIIHAFRAKQALSAEELLVLRKNLRKLGPFNAAPSSQIITALRSLVSPLQDKLHKFKVPGTCAGGVCAAYAGLRKTMDPTTALVTDIPVMRDFKRILSHSNLTTSKVPRALLRSRSLAKRAIGLKGALAAVLVSAGLGTKALIDKARK